MSELAINATPEVLVLAGFMIGLVLHWIGAGIGAILGIFGKDDPGM